MNNLRATYRVQLHKEFSLRDLEKLIPYLRGLGVSTLYASPVFEAVPGSTHGYDVFNPNCINPEIGSEEGLRSVSGQLAAAGIQWLQDIVPNHMAYSPHNPWLRDVLEKGPQSHYASFFDIDWNNEAAGNRLMAPFLGSAPEEAIRNGNLKLDLDEDRLVFRTGDAHWPLREQSYKTAFGENFELGKTEISRQRIDAINNDHELLMKIEAEQFYRLCPWTETDSRINYRRFFIVNALICLSIQHENVMAEHHQLVFRLLKESVFHGLRIDHIDGLYNPLLYLERLRAAVGDDVAIVVEKILEPGENLPGEWPVEGNTGYDFLSFVNNLLTHAPAEKALTKFYRNLTHEDQPFADRIAEKKSYILHRHMQGELQNLLHLFLSLRLVDETVLASVSQESLREAIGAFLVYCPVYRYYGQRFPLDAEEATAVRSILDEVRQHQPGLSEPVEILEHVFLHRPQESDEDHCKRTAHFYSRCMQFSGPLMAKGVEDTLMYTDHRFIAHNEVGDSPSAFGQSVPDFHRLMKERQEHWPLSINATATHDTKRGEDVRARLQVITDLSEEWLEAVRSWRQMNTGLKSGGKPNLNDEYFIYQTLIGAYPMPAQDTGHLQERLDEYLQKALREAKTRSSWDEPDEEYEGAAKSFTAALLQPGSLFQQSFQSLLARIADHGIINSLVQVLLKFTCPGVPDVYQGCELWDLSLVDPDNRRPVNYEQRQRLLENLRSEKIETLWESRYEGGIKLWLVQQLFQLRKKYPFLFSEGEYLPLQVKGRHKDHVIAFARRHEQDFFITAAALHTAILADEPLQIDWEDTAILLPNDGSWSWQHYLQEGVEGGGELKLSNLFAHLPLAVLQGRKVTGQKRSAGILLPLFSLPSRFGVGDLGPEAASFARFLHRGGQSYWQLLPLNPTEGAQGHSPYSSISSRAGNTLFISPELLVRDGWLDASLLEGYEIENNGRADYEAALRLRSLLFDEAWQAWKSGANSNQRARFGAFQQAQKEWLDDFALYQVLKEGAGGKPWYDWEDALRWRDPDRIKVETSKHREKIEKIKWLQFVFAQQWSELKQTANSLGVQFIGDIPFYVSHDAADVWTNPHLFALDKEGRSTIVAGVPPDAFSDDGQLWGMPVFNWEALKQERYAWWISRLRRNTELFDLVRLDHFRAFSSYWAVPGSAATAREGSWVEGPGAPFFEAVEQALGHLPFVAEDLGEIDESVYQLRDRFNLPGMKVLQFAFGDETSRRMFIPHYYTPNFVVYTGTHDNNTTRGWFVCDAGDATRAQLEAYVGRGLSAAEVSQVLSRMAYASVARTAIIPLQDVLNLDERARINRPASPDANWTWRLLPGQASALAEELLRKWTIIYDRM